MRFFIINVRPDRRAVEGGREWVRQSAAPVPTASRFKLAQPDRGAEHGEFGFGASAAGVQLWSGMTHPALRLCCR
jgi:hypothetical protein